MGTVDYLSNIRGTHFSVTAYNENIVRIQDKTLWPQYVKEVGGGMEECPETGRLHYQGRVSFTRQVRGSVFKNWMPGAHIEVARNVAALSNYVMKPETAAGPKEVLTNPVPQNPYRSYDDLCRLVTWFACYQDPEWFDEIYAVIEANTREQRLIKLYWYAVENIIVRFPYLMAALERDSMSRFWSRTFFGQRRLMDESLSITALGSFPDLSPDVQYLDLTENNDCKIQFPV